MSKARFVMLKENHAHIKTILRTSCARSYVNRGGYICARWYLTVCHEPPKHICAAHGLKSAFTFLNVQHHLVPFLQLRFHSENGRLFLCCVWLFSFHLDIFLSCFWRIVKCTNKVRRLWGVYASNVSYLINLSSCFAIVGNIFLLYFAVCQIFCL